MKSLLEQLSQRPLVGDGAMGTVLYAQGIDVSQCLEALVVEHPALIAAIHADYARAGADIITTHTFGANRMRLAAHGLGDKVAAFNTAAVRLAQGTRDATPRDVWIAGNVGPVGQRVAWDDAAQGNAVADAYREQIGALVEAGVDLLLFETFSDIAELEVAVQAAQQLCTLPLVASMSYDTAGLTLAGQRVEDTTARLVAAGVDVIGANCSVGPAEMVATLRRMRLAAPHAQWSVTPNAGLPVADDEGQMCYPVDATAFAEYVAEFLAMGAAIVGGCCGTTPEYTAAMRGVVDNSGFAVR